MNYIRCYDEKDHFIDVHHAPFDVEIDCCSVYVHGKNFHGMKLRGRCETIFCFDAKNLKNIDIRGFIDLKISEIYIDSRYTGLLKILEFNCKAVRCGSKKLCEIMNKYLSEPDPLMRDIEGFKLEMAINGYGERL